MKPHQFARFGLIATGTLLICSIVLTIVGYMIFLSDPQQGPFDMYRARELTMGLFPTILLTGAFFGAWFLRTRWLQITMLVIYFLVGVYACMVGFVAWRYTGSIATLITFPLVYLVSVPALATLQYNKKGK